MPLTYEHAALRGERGCAWRRFLAVAAAGLAERQQLGEKVLRDGVEQVRPRWVNIVAGGGRSEPLLLNAVSPVAEPLPVVRFGLSSSHNPTPEPASRAGITIAEPEGMPHRSKHLVHLTGGARR
eukprot:CAMPEP_0181392294 /NCGR_PEP_ID=MMETSP1106-20121128/26505_1 /TAXON_ID=81844 /ORGANISM="Mantoniella antarctica, Strain SL-175" /LENGTH=123 /DNA_ID=CAMNT_0023513389 /DNA_START=997 /DNA_END=1365 /DNA_ORIENTATION=-